MAPAILLRALPSTRGPARGAGALGRVATDDRLLGRESSPFGGKRKRVARTPPEGHRFTRNGQTVEVPVSGNLTTNSGIALITSAINGAGVALLQKSPVGEALARSELVQVLEGCFHQFRPCPCMSSRRNPRRRSAPVCSRQSPSPGAAVSQRRLCASRAHQTTPSGHFRHMFLRPFASDDPS
jgi:DNA-binding transcriptional LysR family regulator